MFADAGGNKDFVTSFQRSMGVVRTQKNPTRWPSSSLMNNVLFEGLLVRLSQKFPDSIFLDGKILKFVSKKFLLYWTYFFFKLFWVFAFCSEMHSGYNILRNSYLALKPEKPWNLGFILT